MTTHAIEHRIFVVGVARSGTTLVQSLLAAHDRLTSFTESHFFSRPFSHLPMLGPVLVRNPRPGLERFLEENEEAPEVLDDFHLPSARALLPFHTRRASRNFLNLLDDLAKRRGKAGWIEKTPRHLLATALIEKVAEPAPHFVHVVRDGLETVASLYRASQNWEKAYDLDECVKRWNAGISLSLALMLDPAHAENHHGVVYEELTAEPERVLSHLLPRLGLEWQPQILERFAEVSQQLITPEEEWKADVGRSIQPSATSQNVLTAEERETVRRGLNRTTYAFLLAHIAEAIG